MNLLHSQQDKAGYGANHIYNGIHRPHFVKMDLLHRYAVYSRFGFRQVSEYGQASFLDGNIQGTALQQPLNVGQMAMIVGVMSSHQDPTASTHKRSTPFPADLQLIAGNPERAQRLTQVFGSQSGIQQGSKQHVAAST
jgi:hypothetical protein